jgi:uncharacterized NAD(P)/FAD-binding protein YdhS
MKGKSHGAAIAATSPKIAAIAATSPKIAATAATATKMAAIATTPPEISAVAATPSTPTAADPRVLAIIGGGFSGLALTIQLLRRAPGALRIVILEPRAELGAGAAYATRDYPYPLNVAAGQMSLDGSAPDDFLDFARAQGISASAGDYLPRQVYGEYLRSRFAERVRAVPESMRPQHRRARVLQLRRGAEGWILWLDDGNTLRADDVVLAIGNAPPARFAEVAPVVGTLGFVEDPWSIGDCAHEDIGSVLLLGSGLTMIDAALRLAAIRPRIKRIHVLSRHGLIPQPQASEARPARHPDLDALRLVAHSSRGLSRALRKLARQVVAAGGDWREVFAAVRPRVPSLWRELPQKEQARFLRHARAYWEVSRHRVPAGPLAAVRALERQGVLEVHAGRLEALRLLDDAIEVTWRPRGTARSRAWLVDRVINCTGPDSRVVRHADPLVQSLLAAGWIRPDAHGLGIDVAADGRVIACDGEPVNGLHYLGPWLRARDWEATAVPELRAHAAQLAAHLVAAACIVRAGSPRR